MLWYRFRGPGHFIIHGFQIAAGVLLGLLGLLNIGSKHGDFAVIGDEEQQNIMASVNPMYQLTLVGVPLVVVMVVYLVTYLGSTCAMSYIHWRKGGVYASDEEGDEEDMTEGLHHH